MSTRRYGAKQREVTATKVMRFETFYGTRNTVEREKHHEEREAKRWLETRLDKAYDHVVKYDRAEANRIAGLLADIKGTKMMTWNLGATTEWEYTYSGIHVTCGVTRLA